MRLNKQNKIIVGALAFLLTLTIGYAVFSQSMNITGTAKAEGEFSLIFSSVGDIEEYGSSNSTANIEDNGNKLSLNIPNLQYPSAYVNIYATITNEGSINAILKDIKIIDNNNNSYINEDIKVTYKNIKVGDIFKSNESKDIVITVTWDKESTTNDVEASFNISLEYEQYTSSLVDSGSSEDTDWTFKVDESGTIISYNYEKGTDVVVPAEVGGIPVTTINQYSFLTENNVVNYTKNNDDRNFFLIKEVEPNFSNVKEKLILLISSNCDEGDAEWSEQIKQTMYFCKNESTCYNASDESIVTSIPDGFEIADIDKAGVFYISPDSSVSLEESLATAEINIKSLDLSQATNLTTIEERTFERAELQSVNFGENSNLKTIEEYAFYENQITELIIPKSVTYIGEWAFYGNQITELVIPNGVTSIGGRAFSDNPLTSILIKRTEEDFLANVTVGTNWYTGSPTITYQAE